VVVSHSSCERLWDIRLLKNATLELRGIEDFTSYHIRIPVTSCEEWALALGIQSIYITT